MAARGNKKRERSGEGPSDVGLRSRAWTRFVRGPDPSLVEELYVPGLAEAVRYDRCCAYFSSTVLAAAARGFGRLIQRLLEMGRRAPRPAVRLVVNEELAAEDVRALTETGDVSRLEASLRRRFKNPKDVLEKRRLAMLGWLAKEGLLEVRVGVMRHGGGIVHAKFGIMTDASGDAVVFSGSGNESAQGLVANYERLEVSTSWDDPDRHREYTQEFDRLWGDEHPDVHTVTLPEALRLKLIKFAPKQPPVVEPSNALARQKAAMVWRFILEAPYLPNGGPTCDATAMVDLWPHQGRVVEETAEAWPDGRLLCDEVGLGKTIEAILVLRRLMAGRGVRRALILLPAGLLKQWQAELREKGGMVFPRLEGLTALVWPDETVEKVSGLAEALQQDVLLMSRETARTENNLPLLLSAEPWDLVVLDEAHAARRREQEEAEFNSGTLLLNLLRKLQLRRRARGILLLSATPMQTHPWEPWDLLSVLGEGGAWLSDFAGVRGFYEAVAAVKAGRCDMPTAHGAALMIASDPDFPEPPGNGLDLRNLEAVKRKLAFVLPTGREQIVRWLRRGSPLARRMHRNTRGTLRRYHEMGRLAEVPPQRRVKDRVFDYQDPAERAVYDSVSRYIEARFPQLEREKRGKGFVMTVYRRRAASCPQALERSLERRRKGLLSVEHDRAHEFWLLREDPPERVDLDDLPEGERSTEISAAFPDDPQVARAERLEVERRLEELRALTGRDSKRDYFFGVLREVTEDGRSVLVFTEYTDTLEYLRDILAPHYGNSVGCYSGEGGQVFDGQTWKAVTKDVITKLLGTGELQVLICTDAASEGLNLQAAGAVINYDLPWNPSKVEQRIGRIDRIGQRFPEVRVVNLFLKDSVDEQVYRALWNRCGLFEHFVGPMQPVLARARRMLLGPQDQVDVGAIDAAAAQVKEDPLAEETYVESLAEEGASPAAGVTRQQVEAALGWLTPEVGVRVKFDSASHSYTLSGPGLPRSVLSRAVEMLERDPSVLPLSPFEPRLRKLVEGLSRSGERLPLVLRSYQRGAFRTTVAYWVGDARLRRIESLAELTKLVEDWDGNYPDPAHWQRAGAAAGKAAQQHVKELEERAAKRQREALARQVQAARLRLLKELGRYLTCLDSRAGDLNLVLSRQVARDIAGADRLRQCLEKLGSYPEWPADLQRDLGRFGQNVTENQRKARLLGTELDAALQDPRWEAGSSQGRSNVPS